MRTGSCNCNSIRFTLAGPVRGASACHCGQCRKQSGHVWASVITKDSDLTTVGGVQWYASSATAKRGFCPTCGCFLFWKLNGSPETSVSLGALDGVTGLHLQKHIFVADKGDYYDIADSVPQQDQ